MSYKCVVCGKKVMTGNNVSHSNRHTRTSWSPNLQSLKILINGQPKKAKVCTNCIKSGKITRPAKRTYKAPAKEAAKAK